MSSVTTASSGVPLALVILNRVAMVQAEAVEARARRRLAMRVAGRFAASVPLQFHGPAARLEDDKERESNAHLDDLNHGKAALAVTTSKILPNVFQGMQAACRPASTKCADGQVFRVRGSHHRRPGPAARRPVQRAEWIYPYDVAARAGQCRIATTPARRKDALPKLAEGVARCAGVLAVAVQIDRDQGYVDTPRKNRSLAGGATFGTWEKQIETLVKARPIPELPEWEGALDPDGVGSHPDREPFECSFPGTLDPVID
ncbi:hypothetical protein ACFY0P_20250 [Streptomyces sp. NPDC001714]|uniref:hypothetical protein n=1 Tax=Streptomyces sp. NPDC001714 TaxID=3364603 RepID=UPI0036A6C0BA